MDITHLDKMDHLIRLFVGFDHRLPLVGCIYPGKQVDQSKATSQITWSMGNDDAKCRWQISQVIKLAKMIKWRFRQLRVYCQLRDISQLLFILISPTTRQILSAPRGVPLQDLFKSPSKSPLDAPCFECHPERHRECHPECQDQFDMVKTHTVITNYGFFPFRLLVFSSFNLIKDQFIKLMANLLDVWWKFYFKFKCKLSQKF